MTRQDSSTKNKFRAITLVLVYGLVVGIAVSVMRWMDYRHMIHSLSVEIYSGIIALIFAGGGIWIGLQMHHRKKPQLETTVEVQSNQAHHEFDSSMGENFGISKREFEVLQLMATGISNQEIADKLFVSLNTVKTHTSNLYMKLEVKSRTQAVVKAKEFGITA